MQTEKNKWIQEVLSSTDSLQQIDSPDITSIVLSRATVKTSSSIMIWRIAASVALLIALNVGTIIFHNASRSADRSTGHQPTMIDLGVSDQEDAGILFFGR